MDKLIPRRQFISGAVTALGGAVLGNTALSSLFPQASIADPGEVPMPYLRDVENWMWHYLDRGYHSICDDPHARPPDFTAGTGARLYYDGVSVIRAILKWTGDKRARDMYECAVQIDCERFETTNGTLASYDCYAGGLLLTAAREGNSRALDAVRKGFERALILADNTPEWETAPDPQMPDPKATRLPRPIGISGYGHCCRKAYFGQETSRLDLLARHARASIDFWASGRPGGTFWGYVPQAPFQNGMCAFFLCMLHQLTGDPGLLTDLRKLADGMWRTVWMPQYQAFCYVVEEGQPLSQAGDLNILCGASNAYLALMTGEQVYQERFDQIVQGQLRYTFGQSFKHLNQLLLFLIQKSSDNFFGGALEWRQCYRSGRPGGVYKKRKPLGQSDAEPSPIGGGKPRPRPQSDPVPIGGGQPRPQPKPKPDPSPIRGGMPRPNSKDHDQLTLPPRGPTAN